MATNNQLNTAWLAQLPNPHHGGSTGSASGSGSGDSGSNDGGYNFG